MAQNNAMNILLTGGTGFVGSALTRALLADGHYLHVWSRDPVSAANVIPGVKVVSALDEMELSSLDAVVNLAGAPIAAARWNAARKKVLRQSRVDLTHRLLAWLVGSGLKPAVLVNASAVGYYGDQGDRAVGIQTPPIMDFTHELCRDWEAAAQDFGGKVCILRLGVVLGSGGMLGKLLPFYKMGLGGTLGSGRQWVPWVHLKDVVAMFRHALLSQPSGVYNIVAPQPIQQKDFSRILSGLLNRPCLGYIPGWVLRTMLGEMSVLLLGGQQIIDGGMPGIGFSFPGLEGALQECLGV